MNVNANSNKQAVDVSHAVQYCHLSVVTNGPSVFDLCRYLWTCSCCFASATFYST